MNRGRIDKLTHPSFEVPRTYLAKVKGSPDAATLDKLRGGIRLEDGMARPLRVDVQEQTERNTWLRIDVADIAGMAGDPQGEAVVAPLLADKDKQVALAAERATLRLKSDR